MSFGDLTILSYDVAKFSKSPLFNLFANSSVSFLETLLSIKLIISLT